ncbi:uncharacterized protein LOC132048795 [Lycium ferocissimum]|uniref:uncharacterized protein LOC132048795 n=1 Tax=Lycium ferocissimum TaxID=112874 RepID=UPI002814F9EF|nr:uncharacterized protein LOC132048795 [Lycium ferocissimum]
MNSNLIPSGLHTPFAYFELQEVFPALGSPYLRTLLTDQYPKTKLGALNFVVPHSWPVDHQVEDVAELMSNGTWNVQTLLQLFSEDIVQHIVQEIGIKHVSNEWDTLWWMMTSSGKFIEGSAWELLGQRANVTVPFHNMWIKGVPFKISFFLWRLWKFKVPVDEVVASIGIAIVSKCCCCNSAQPESINHLFLCGDFAAKVWSVFNAAAGLTMNYVQVKHAIRSWWGAKCRHKLKPVFKAISAFIVWQIWKWRNNQLHEGTMTFNRVIYHINLNIHLLCKVLFPGLNVPKRWFKCNRGNPGPSFAAFCITNEEGDLVYAAAKKLQDGSNLVAEAEAIRMGLIYFLDKKLFPLIIETDSMVMKMILAAEWKIQWGISMVVEDIQRMRRDQMVIVVHIHREGNGLADFLTNMVFDFAEQYKIELQTDDQAYKRAISNMQTELVLVWTDAASVLRFESGLDYIQQKMPTDEYN